MLQAAGGSGVWRRTPEVVGAAALQAAASCHGLGGGLAEDDERVAVLQKPTAGMHLPASRILVHPSLHVGEHSDTLWYILRQMSR